MLDMATSSAPSLGGRVVPKKKKPPSSADVQRKAALYNLGSHQSFPSTRKPKHRHRLALQQLLREDQSSSAATGEPTAQCQMGRPEAAQVGFIRDLQTTVPEIPRSKARRNARGTTAEWKLGRSNSTSSYKLSASGIDGMLEPTDAAREVLAVTCPTSEFSNLLVAYPPAAVASVAKALADPAQNWVKPCISRPGQSAHNSDTPGGWQNTTKPGEQPVDNNHAKAEPWAPPTFPHRIITTSPGPHKNPPSNLNPTPLRRDNKAGGGVPTYTLPTHTVDTFLRQAQKAERSYNALTARVNAHKNPALMYSLPVATPSRSCRLGLETLASDLTADSRRSSRPKSAVHLIKNVLKVAGAKIRPKTARMSYLKTATVYCVDTPDTNTMEEYALKIQAEKDRRKNVVNRKQAMHRIVRYNSIAERSVEYIFNCLKRQAMDNVPLHLQAKYDALELDDYMKMVNTEEDEHPYLKSNPTDPSYDVGWDSLTLGLLWVDRAQFTKAMQCLKMTPVDVNVLFSVFDFELEHKIEVGQVCREIRTLQMAKHKKHFPDLMLGGNRTTLREP
ncbi:hypothetical protein, variant 1 [Aphanomyces astaci]|uniref:Uncharacterized protein n=1 Tax=Aphanomyces astaci TaxID=112090 RepID=W4FQ54_APHAT|nr:hypothetical protein, variant 1 [Aphanomyces astaci]ETV69066.1 hypothetical protein, variant 1 [Aphanomyces astaci]|eukprot:XP_009841526.1 hypothetical protein, variant 1 [Aphanomyces astaci]